MESPQINVGVKHTTQPTDNVTVALNQLASPAISKTNTIKTLTTANKQLAEALASLTKENEELLKMV